MYNLFTVMNISDVTNLIVAFAGIMTSILTILIIRESRLMRKYYSTPEISIYLKFAEASPSLMFLYIENLGMGTAHHVEFKIIEDFKFYQRDAEKLIDKGVFKRELQHFYPKQQFKFLVDSLQERTNEELKDPIVIAVRYNDDFGATYNRLYHLEIELYSGDGMMTPGDTHLRVISYRLEQIQKDFGQLTRTILKSIQEKDKK